MPVRRVFSELTAPWVGADQWGCELKTGHVYRLYHLLNGGVDDVGDLATLSGIKPHQLARMNLRRLWLSADNTWHRVRDSLPHVELAGSHTVQCRACRAHIHTVPCMLCRSPQNFRPSYQCVRRTRTDGC